MNQISCPKCAGKGKVALSDVLQETLDAVGPYPKGGTAPEIWPTLGSCDKVDVTAINNRLERLHAMGLLNRKRTNGRRGWTYSVAKRK